MIMNHCRITGHRKTCYSIAWKNNSEAPQCWKVEGKQISDTFTLYPGETRYWMVDRSARINISVSYGEDWSAEATGLMRYSGRTDTWTFYTGEDTHWTFEQVPGSASLDCKAIGKSVHAIAEERLYRLSGPLCNVRLSNELLT